MKKETPQRNSTNVPKITPRNNNPRSLGGGRPQKEGTCKFSVKKAR